MCYDAKFDIRIMNMQSLNYELNLKYSASYADDTECLAIMNHEVR